MDAMMPALIAMKTAGHATGVRISARVEDPSAALAMVMSPIAWM